MAFRVGPIEFPFHEKLSWSNRRRLSMVPIPMGRDAGYTAGVEPTSYQITTSFYAATDAAAKTLRRQLHELARNPYIDFIWVEFDLDGNEHDGWYLLNDVSTDPLPAVFGDYPVQFTITRLGNPGSHFLGTYWTRADLTNDWGLTGKVYITLPNGVGRESGWAGRDGDNCTNAVIAFPALPVFSYSQPLADFYAGRCRVQDTMTTGETDEDNWQDVYGPEHQFQGDIVIGNDLIRFTWSATTNRTTLEVYSAAAEGWLQAASDFEIYAFSNLLEATYPPLLTRFDWDRVEWQMSYLGRFDTSITATFSLSRGTYFVSTEFEPGALGMSQSSGLVTPAGVAITSVQNSVGSAAPTVGLPVDPGLNYAAAILDNGTCCGFLYTKKGSGQPIAGTTSRINQSVFTFQPYRGAIFAVEYPLLPGLNLGNLGLEYLAGVRQQLVLTEPPYIGQLSTVNSIDAYLLEDRDTLLTESGGRLLLE